MGWHHKRSCANFHQNSLWSGSDANYTGLCYVLFQQKIWWLTMAASVLKTPSLQTWKSERRWKDRKGISQADGVAKYDWAAVRLPHCCSLVERNLLNHKPNLQNNWPVFHTRLLISLRVPISHLEVLEIPFQSRWSVPTNLPPRCSNPLWSNPMHIRQWMPCSYIKYARSAELGCDVLCMFNTVGIPHNSKYPLLAPLLCLQNSIPSYQTKPLLSTMLSSFSTFTKLLLVQMRLLSGQLYPVGVRKAAQVVGKSKYIFFMSQF